MEWNFKLIYVVSNIWTVNSCNFLLLIHVIEIQIQFASVSEQGGCFAGLKVKDRRYLFFTRRQLAAIIYISWYLNGTKRMFPGTLSRKTKRRRSRRTLKAPSSYKNNYKDVALSAGNDKVIKHPTRRQWMVRLIMVQRIVRGWDVTYHCSNLISCTQKFIQNLRFQQ